MNYNKQTEEQAEAAMHSIDTLNHQQANPFLFTRIEQRLQNNLNTQIEVRAMFHFALVLLVCIAANLFTYQKFTAHSNSNNSKSGIETFVGEYGLQQSDENI